MPTVRLCKPLLTLIFKVNKSRLRPHISRRNKELRVNQMDSLEVDFDRLAEALGVDRSTLPAAPRRPDEPIEGREIVPDWTSLRGEEYAIVETAFPKRSNWGQMSSLSDREYLDHVLNFARHRFQWSALSVDPEAPVELVRCKMKRWSVHQAGCVWTLILEVVTGKLSVERVEAFRLLSERGERERARIFQRRRKLIGARPT